ncbi:MAG: DUF1257 domain-containing protein [Desulfatiglans sp.]|nr:DUF1257 domain-containing protein [Desulfatiglans sp.]
MSHFTKIKTRLIKKEHLIMALQDLGYEVNEGKVQIRGYEGQETEVDIMIPTKNRGYDLGFKKEGDAYELVADWYGIQDIKPESFLKHVQQKYAYHAVKERMEEQGFELVEEENEEDNTIHMTLRRAVY